MRAISMLTLLATLLPAVAAAEEPAPSFAEPWIAAFAFGGRSVDADMGESTIPFAPDSEPNRLLGLGMQAFVYASRLVPGLSYGFEAGVAARLAPASFGDDTEEAWIGAVARYDALTLFERVRVSPAFTFGLSAVNGTMPGREARLEARSPDRDAELLLYLAPEVNLSLVGHEEIEVFYRLHHRSGAWGTLGDMDGASNSQVFGLRVHF